MAKARRAAASRCSGARFRPAPRQRRHLVRFQVLCGGPRSQNDYLELARGYHTVLLSAIPRMSASMSSEARRFTWLVDIFYDHKVKLIATADCGPDGLYTQGTQASEFFRTASRLTEMRSREYLGLPHLS
jgi:cell division protein ZapE